MKWENHFPYWTCLRKTGPTKTRFCKQIVSTYTSYSVALPLALSMALHSFSQTHSYIVRSLFWARKYIFKPFSCTDAANELWWKKWNQIAVKNDSNGTNRRAEDATMNLMCARKRRRIKNDSWSILCRSLDAFVLCMSVWFVRYKQMVRCAMKIGILNWTIVALCSLNEAPFHLPQWHTMPLSGVGCANTGQRALYMLINSFYCQQMERVWQCAALSTGEIRSILTFSHVCVNSNLRNVRLSIETREPITIADVYIHNLFACDNLLMLIGNFSYKEPNTIGTRAEISAQAFSTQFHSAYSSLSWSSFAYMVHASTVQRNTSRWYDNFVISKQINKKERRNTSHKMVINKCEWIIRLFHLELDWTRGSPSCLRKELHWWISIISINNI